MWTPIDPHTVQAVFTTESRQKNESIFTLTHTPMQRILVSHNRIGLENGQFVGEHDILQLLEHSRPLDGNRVWFVVGETGSGKSELCQWLEYQLRERHVPIHVARRHASLNGILDVLYAHLPFLPSGSTGPLPLDILTNHLHTHLRLKAHRERCDLGYIEQLSPYLPELAHQLYHSGIPILVFPDHMPPPPVGLPILSWLATAAREVLGIQTLEPILRAVSEHYAMQGKRPILLLEDITTLSFLRDDLLDYIFDLSAPGFDVVIGLTSGYEHTHLRTGTDLSEMAYVRDRLSARFQLSHDSGETYFLNQPRDLHDLIRRYLGCLPPPPVKPSPDFMDLYPFTPIMIERLYLHLIESGNARQTPRNLLDAVIKPALSLMNPPHLTFLRPHPYLRSPSIHFSRQGLDDMATALYYWHGQERNGEIHVSAGVTATFGYPDLPPIQAYPQPLGPDPLIQSAPINRSVDEWREALRELQAWHIGHGSFPKRQVLKRGIERLLRILSIVRELQHPKLNALSADPLEFTRGGEHLPIYLPDSGDYLPEHWPVLTFPRDLPAQFFEECLTFAFSAGHQIDCFSDAAFTHEILEQQVSGFRAQMLAHLERYLTVAYPTFVLGMWWLTQHVSLGQTIDPKTPAGRKALLRYDLSPKEIGIHAAWQQERPHGVLHRTHRTLREQRHIVRSLFISVYHHRDDLLDSNAFDQALVHFDPTLFLQTLALLPLGTLKSVPYRQRGSKLTLYALLKPLAEYATALLSYPNVTEDLQEWDLLSEVLNQALEHTDRLDTLCRQLERWAYRAGWVLTTPADSHIWRASEWHDIARESREARQNLDQSPPLTQITVARAWRDRLLSLEPVLWMSTLRNYYHTFLHLAREQYPTHNHGRLIARSTYPNTQDLEHLILHLEKVLEQTLTLPEGLAIQIQQALSRLEGHYGVTIQGVRESHGIHTLNDLTHRSRDESLQFTSDILTVTAELLSYDP